MKQRQYIILILLLAFQYSFGQKVRIIPKIGFSLSTLANQEIAVSDDYVQKEKSRPMFGAFVGLDVEYSMFESTCFL